MKTEHKRLAFDLVLWIATPLLVLSLLASEAGAKPGTASNASWRAECGACHVPYPPSLLSASQWQRIMGSLGKHFGSDASLDGTIAAEILAFLNANAGRDRGGSSTESLPRITTSRRFLKEHDDAQFSSALQGHPADCGACHPGAANGDFDEDRVTRPQRAGRTR